MSSDEYLRVTSRPQLRQPVVLAAFAGWNDASQVATFALSTLVKAWSAQRFAEIDSEVFYDFSETRPTIHLEPSGQRALEWPTMSFYAHQLPEAKHDVVLLVGPEPQLRWRTFTDQVVHAAEEVDASCLVTLGGLLADIPHTIEPRLTGFASTSQLLPHLEKLGVSMSSYEGPTGIVGVLHDAWRKTGLPAMSLWGNVPHYISAAPNPSITLALLQRISSVLGVPLPLGSLESEAAAFRARVDEALEQNEEAREYVEQLEMQFSGESVSPPSPELIAELEEFLRRRRPPPDDQSE